MKAMVLSVPGRPLSLREIPAPRLRPGQVLVRVTACGVCRTDLHIADGELSGPKLPLVLGHEIVGVVEKLGSHASGLKVGRRVGVPWLAWTCGRCPPCRSGRENLCRRPLFTGYTRDGGYAEYAAANARFCFAVPPGYSDVEAAPLFCAGLIGFRCLRLAGPGKALGLYGFGAAAHILVQVARAQGRRVYAFTREGDRAAQRLALSLGAAWAGGSSKKPPVPLDAAIIFAPVGALVPTALKAVAPGGTVVCGGIHMSDIPSFPYALLWGERAVRSVANLTREDGAELMKLAAERRIQTRTTAFPFARANDALAALRGGRVTGAAVLVP